LRTNSQVKKVNHLYRKQLLLISVLFATLFTITIVSISAGSDQSKAAYEITEVQDFDELSPAQDFSIIDQITFSSAAFEITLAISILTLVTAWIGQSFAPNLQQARFLVYRNLKIAH
jgi:hypothetical protein